MSAITPNSPAHAHLPPLASRFVDVAALPWAVSQMHPGVQTKKIGRASCRERVWIPV